MNEGDSPQRVLTVSELTLRVRNRLEHGFPDLWVEGELSNLRAPASGHVYFTLKDPWSQIRAVLFRGNAQRLRFELREGIQVLVRGRLTVYEPRGEYQLALDYVEPKGVGALQVKFEQLKEKLAREGLFDESRKRPLPILPRRVGIVTSLTGAAIRDMLAIIRRRCPIIEIVIYPVPVQGEEAAPEIAEGIQALGTRAEVDVMIVGRGGGSWEDLWCFNEEPVVRAIAGASIPVVSAVGHEIDFTLADFASDYRAPTPSAAAEAVAPVLDDLMRAVSNLWMRQERAARGQLALLREQAHGLYRQMPLLRVRLLRHSQYLDDVFVQLAQAFRRTVSELRDQVIVERHALSVTNPLARVRSTMVLVQQMVKRAEQRMLSVVALKRQLAGERVAMLDSLSPLSILGRGYSIVQKLPDGVVVRDAREVSVDEDIRARLAHGQLLCRVRQVLPES